MKTLTILAVLAFAALNVVAADIKSGEELISAMHSNYAGKWYRTLTFVQKTTNYKPDGTSEASTWYEALNAPGQLRIDFDPLEKHDGILLSNGKLYSFRDGKMAGSRAFVHPLLVLGFDVYMQAVETTLAQLKGMSIDMSVIHQEKWMNRTVYVVGAKQGDLYTPQFWIDKKISISSACSNSAVRIKRMCTKLSSINIKRPKGADRCPPTCSSSPTANVRLQRNIRTSRPEWTLVPTYGIPTNH